MNEQGLKQELKALIENYKEDLCSIQEKADDGWDSYESAYYEGASSILDMVILNLEKLLEK